MEDTDVPQLSAHALQALQEFYAEQAAEPTETDQGGAKEMPREDWVGILCFQGKKAHFF